jgi:hypothetical protein
MIMSKHGNELKQIRCSVIIALIISAISCSGHKNSENISHDSANLKIDSLKNNKALTKQVSSNIADTNANGFDDCDKFYEFEVKAHSLETISDKYLKDLLHNYYTLDENQVNKDFDKYVKEYYPNVDSNSVLKIKINDGFAKGYEVYISGKNFDPKKHKINESEKFTCLRIDNHIFWGTDEGFPEEEIDKFEVKYNGKSILIPKIDYSNLDNPLRFAGKKYHGVFLVDSKEHYVIFILFGSDGAGSYNASFIFKDGKYLRLVVEKLG